MQFLYFLKDAPVQVSLSDWGLAHVGDQSRRISSRQVHAPHMGDGLLVTRGDVELCRIDPSGDNQVWHKFPSKFTGEREVWCGWWLDKVPCAKTLGRSEQLRGVDVELVGGEKWLVPVLRRFIESDQPYPVSRTQLPTILDYNADGELVLGAVVPQYRTVWTMATDLSSKVIENSSSNSGTNLSFAEVVDFCSQVIGINYAVTAFELTKLGLLTEEVTNNVVRVALDFEGFEREVRRLVNHTQVIESLESVGAIEESLT